MKSEWNSRGRPLIGGCWRVCGDSRWQTGMRLTGSSLSPIRTPSPTRNSFPTRTLSEETWDKREQTTSILRIKRPEISYALSDPFYLFIYFYCDHRETSTSTFWRWSTQLRRSNPRPACYFKTTLDDDLRCLTHR